MKLGQNFARYFVHFLGNGVPRKKKARKGFRPPSAMKGIGYFQNLGILLRNFLEIFWILRGIFWEFLRRIFFEEFIWRNFLGEIFFEDFFWSIFQEEDLFFEDFLGEILWEELVSRNQQDFRVILSKWKEKGRRKDEFRSLEVRRRLIALKNHLRIYIQ